MGQTAEPLQSNEAPRTSISLPDLDHYSANLRRFTRISFKKYDELQSWLETATDLVIRDRILLTHGGKYGVVPDRERLLNAVANYIANGTENSYSFAEQAGVTQTLGIELRSNYAGIMFNDFEEPMTQAGIAYRLDTSARRVLGIDARTQNQQLYRHVFDENPELTAESDANAEWKKLLSEYLDPSSHKNVKLPVTVEQLIAYSILVFQNGYDYHYAAELSGIKDVVEYYLKQMLFISLFAAQHVVCMELQRDCEVPPPPSAGWEKQWKFILTAYTEREELRAVVKEHREALIEIPPHQYLRLNPLQVFILDKTIERKENEVYEFLESIGEDPRQLTRNFNALKALALRTGNWEHIPFRNTWHRMLLICAINTDDHDPIVEYCEQILPNIRVLAHQVFLEWDSTRTTSVGLTGTLSTVEVVTLIQSSLTGTLINVAEKEIRCGKKVGYTIVNSVIEILSQTLVPQLPKLQLLKSGAVGAYISTNSLLIQTLHEQRVYIDGTNDEIAGWEIINERAKGCSSAQITQSHGYSENEITTRSWLALLHLDEKLHQQSDLLVEVSKHQRPPQEYLFTISANKEAVFIGDRRIEITEREAQVLELIISNKCVPFGTLYFTIYPGEQFIPSSEAHKYRILRTLTIIEEKLFCDTRCEKLFKIDLFHRIVTLNEARWRIDANSAFFYSEALPSYRGYATDFILTNQELEIHYSDNSIRCIHLSATEVNMFVYLRDHSNEANGVPRWITYDELAQELWDAPKANPLHATHNTLAALTRKLAISHPIAGAILNSKYFGCRLVTEPDIQRKYQRIDISGTMFEFIPELLALRTIQNKIIVLPELDVRYLSTLVAGGTLQFGKKHILMRNLQRCGISILNGNEFTVEKISQDTNRNDKLYGVGIDEHTHTISIGGRLIRVHEGEFSLFTFLFTHRSISLREGFEAVFSSEQYIEGDRQQQVRLYHITSNLNRRLFPDVRYSPAIGMAVKQQCIFLHPRRWNLTNDIPVFISDMLPSQGAELTNASLHQTYLELIFNDSTVRFIPLTNKERALYQYISTHSQTERSVPQWITFQQLYDHLWTNTDAHPYGTFCHIFTSLRQKIAIPFPKVGHIITQQSENRCRLIQQEDLKTTKLAIAINGKASTLMPHLGVLVQEHKVFRLTRLRQHLLLKLADGEQVEAEKVRSLTFALKERGLVAQGVYQLIVTHNTPEKLNVGNTSWRKGITITETGSTFTVNYKRGHYRAGPFVFPIEALALFSADPLNTTGIDIFSGKTVATIIVPAKEDVDTISLMKQEYGRFPLLSIIGEQILLIRAAAGDITAMERLHQSNMRLVAKIANHFLSIYDTRIPNLAVKDLIEEGSIGLQKAIHKFDIRRPGKDAQIMKFSTVATWWIRQAINYAIQNREETIRVPVHQKEKIAMIYKICQRMQKEQIEQSPELVTCYTFNDHERELLLSGQAPTKLQVAYERRLKFVTAVLRGDFAPPVSLEQKRDPTDEEGDSLHDLVPAETDIPRNHEAKEVVTIVETIIEQFITDEINRRILRLRLTLEDGEEYSYTEIGKKVGLGKKQVAYVCEKYLPIIANQTNAYLRESQP